MFRMSRLVQIVIYNTRLKIDVAEALAALPLTEIPFLLIHQTVCLKQGTALKFDECCPLLQHPAILCSAPPLSQ